MSGKKKSEKNLDVPSSCLVNGMVINRTQHATTSSIEHDWGRQVNIEITISA